MSTRIRNVAVLGAGTMGAQIAAHFANAGVPVLLLDVTADAARDGLARARALKPDPFFTSDRASLIRTGSFDDDLPGIASSDWILEAIVERLDVKQALFARVEQYRAPHAIVSSNTSGIPISALAEGRSPAFRAHMLGTHFFNPPRYLRLVEVIATPETDPAVVGTVTEFADHRLGKGIVAARDTPNFIANRIGLYGVMQILRAWATGAYTIEEIDAITGPAIGRPKSATFRTMDLAGIDILAHVVGNLAATLEREDDKAVFNLPQIVTDLVARGWIGAKSGQGFYKKDAGGEILSLDPATMDVPRRRANAAAVARCREVHRGSRATHQGALQRQGQGRRIPERHPGPDARVRGAGRARRRAFDRRRRPRDAMGIRLGARTVRNLGRNRHRARDRGMRTSPLRRRSSPKHWRAADSARNRRTARTPASRPRALDCSCCAPQRTVRRS